MWSGEDNAALGLDRLKRVIKKTGTGKRKYGVKREG